MHTSSSMNLGPYALSPCYSPFHVCRSGLILYRHIIPRKQLSKSSELDLGASPHDYATV